MAGQRVPGPAQGPALLLPGFVAGSARMLQARVGGRATGAAVVWG